MLENFMSSAFAAANITSSSDPLHDRGDFGFFIVLAIFFAVFYWLVIRPQNKRAKEHGAMLEKLALGDEVVTTGGILGVIKNLEKDFILLEIADNVEIKIQKLAVATCLPKGTRASV